MAYPPSAPAPSGALRSGGGHGAHASDREERDHDEDGHDEQGTSYLPSSSARTTSGRRAGGYTSLAVGDGSSGDGGTATSRGVGVWAFARDARRRQERRSGSIDGTARDDHPVLARKGCSVLVDSREPWASDPDELLTFVLAERPILPPALTLRVTAHRAALTPDDEELMELPFDDKSTELFSFTVPLRLTPPRFVPRGVRGAQGAEDGEKSKTAGGQALVDVNASASSADGAEAERPASSPLADDGPSLDALPPGAQLRAVGDTVPCYRSAPWLRGALTYAPAGATNVRVLPGGTVESAREGEDEGGADGGMESAREKEKDAGDAVSIRAPLRSAAAPAASSGPSLAARVRAPARVVAAWNAMRKRGLAPPWQGPPLRATLASRDSVQRESSRTQAAEDTDPATARAALRLALERFIEADDDDDDDDDGPPLSAGRARAQRSEPSAKILLCEHVPYGWDLPALEAALTALIERAQPALPAPARASAGGGLSEAGIRARARRIARVALSIERTPPWLDLQVRRVRAWLPLPRALGGGDGASKGFPIDAGATRAGAESWVIACCAAAFAGGVFFIIALGANATSRKLGGMTGPPSGTPWLVLLLSAALGAAGAYTMAQISKVCASDTVILAHPLKRWAHTGVPASATREQAVAALRDREDEEAGSGAPDEQTPTLARADDGWHVLVAGMREGDWLRAHQAWLLDTLRRRKAGDLSDEFDEEAQEPDQGDSAAANAQDSWTGL